MTQRRSGWLIDWLVIGSFSTLDLACHMDKQDIHRTRCRITCIETLTTHTAFLSTDFQVSREVTKPLLEVVTPLQPATCAELNATISCTATSSVSKHQDIEDIAYALYVVTLGAKTTKALLLIRRHPRTEMDMEAEADHREMDRVLTLEVDTLELPLMVAIEVVLLEDLPVEVAALVVILAEILHLDATCTTTKGTTEELSHPADRAALVIQVADLEVIEYLATELAPGTGAEGNAAFGYPTKECRATVGITDL
jgi:hypothetical protein